MEFDVKTPGDEMPYALARVDYEKLINHFKKNEVDRWKQAVHKRYLLGWFVGQGMKLTGGKADPAFLNKILNDEADKWQESLNSH